MESAGCQALFRLIERDELAGDCPNSVPEPIILSGIFGDQP